MQEMLVLERAFSVWYGKKHFWSFRKLNKPEGLSFGLFGYSRNNPIIKSCFRQGFLKEIPGSNKAELTELGVQWLSWFCLQTHYTIKSPYYKTDLRSIYL
jgi:hypothetical protein